MAQQDVLKIIYLLLLSVIAVNLALCTRYSAYVGYGLDNSIICHPLGQKRSKLPKFNNSAVLIKANNVFDRWDRLQDVHCKFVLKANKGDGLFAVIQKISFRRNATHCIDYVEFKRSDNHPTEKFCGQMDHNKMSYPDPDLNPSYKFRKLSANTYAEYDELSESGGEIETRIFISKEQLQPWESLDLSIVYTPYKDCSKVNLEEYRSVGFNTCIWKSFFCDGFYNCVPYICSDEASCPASNTDIISSGTGTKVTVGAVTTMILCFIIFIMCIWICKRHGQLCWSRDFATPNVCPTRGTAQFVPDSGGSVIPHIPTAPMLEVAVTPPVLDKDLPPTYDSLFPERSNSAAQ